MTGFRFFVLSTIAAACLAAASSASAEVQLARSECGTDGFWHVRTYDISDANNWKLIEDQPTNQPCPASAVINNQPRTPISSSIYGSPMSRYSRTGVGAGGNWPTIEPVNRPNHYSVARFYGTSRNSQNDPAPCGQQSSPAGSWTDRSKFMAEQIANAGHGRLPQFP